MAIKKYYKIELNTDMEEQEIGMLEDNRFFCNIDTASFHADKHTIRVTISEPEIKIVMTMIANWLASVNLADHITSIKDITEYTTGFMNKRLDDFIKSRKK